MGIDANAILTTNPTPLEVMGFLNSVECVEDLNISPTHDNNFVLINFKWHGERRSMACFYDGNCKCDYESAWPHDACLLVLKKWGMSDAIIMALIDKFGGFYMLNDSTDKWSYKQ